MTYAEKLKDPRWQKKRLYILERDNFTCQHCNSKTKSLQIHHVEYFDNIEPWDYDDNSLITVCEDCHGQEAIRFKHEQYLLKTLSLRGFLANDILALSALINGNDKFTQMLKKTIRKFANSN